MAGSSKGFYMKDGRLFESVFFNRGGNQDFGLYADDGQDIGRKFYQGVGHHETGYKRWDGVDIGSLLFDNTEPVQGYITHNGGSYKASDDKYYQLWCIAEYANFHYTDWNLFKPSNMLTLLAHPTRGSGLYSYWWDWGYSFPGYSTECHMSTGGVHREQSSISWPFPEYNDRTVGWWGLWLKNGVATTYFHFSCKITDTLTGSSYTAYSQVNYVHECSYTCSDYCNCGDSCD